MIVNTRLFIRQVMLNSYMDFMPDSTQFKWLANDFATFDRSVTPWFVALFSYSFFSVYFLY